MQFKIDENLPVEIAEALRSAGYDAVMVMEQGLGGQPDTQIAAICAQEGRIIVTLDLDFANIHAYPPQNYPGIMVFRVRRQDKLHLLPIFQQALRLLEAEPIEHRLWIIEERGIRIRGEDT